MEQPSFNTWTIIFLFAAVQGYFLSFLLYFNKRGNIQANKTLAFLIFIFSVTLTYYVLYWTGYSNVYQWTNGWIEPLVFLSGPITYLYLLQLNQQTPDHFKWHYLPFLLNFLFMLPFILHNIFGRIQFLRNYFFIPLSDSFDTIGLMLSVAWLLSLVVYAVLILKLVQNEKEKLNSFALEAEKSKYKWLRRVMLLYCGYALAFISYYLLSYASLIRPEYDYAISGCMTLFIYSVGYMGFTQPELFQRQFQEISPQNDIQVLKMTEFEAPSKYEHSTLKPEQAIDLAGRLTKLMETERPYLQNTLKIQHLAEMLGISTHHLSQVVNVVLNQNYADFIHTYRIGEAQKLLADKSLNDKILSVAFEVGYSNKATFNANFKKITGMSPTEYRKFKLEKNVA